MSMYLLVPEWFTESTIPNNTPQQALDDYNAETSEGLGIGDPNPIWNWILTNATRGWPLQLTGRDPESLARMEATNDLRAHTKLNDLKRIVAAGGDLFNYPVYFEVSTAELQNNVPNSWPNSEYPDPNSADPANPDMIRHTLETYYRNSLTYPEQWEAPDGPWYCPNQNWEATGAYLRASLYINLPVTIRDQQWYENNRPTDDT